MARNRNKVGLSILALTIGISLSACQTTTTLTPQVGAAQEIVYDHGEATVISKKDKSVARIAATDSPVESRLGLGVGLFNSSDSQANVGPENVSVATVSGTTVRVWTYEALVKEAKTRAAWMAVAVAMSGAANAYAAAQPATINSYGTAYGRGGSSTYSASSTIYNPANSVAAQQMVQANTNRNISQISGQLGEVLGSLKGSVLRLTTVRPGEIGAGVIVIDKPKFKKDEPNNLRITIRFNGDVHEFLYTVGTQ